MTCTICCHISAVSGGIRVSGITSDVSNVTASSSIGGMRSVG